jgi:hypothetical protein
MDVKIAMATIVKRKFVFLSLFFFKKKYQNARMKHERVYLNLIEYKVDVLFFKFI